MAVDSSPDRRNVELKARLEDLESGRAIASRLATERLADQQQTDTYFYCVRGRLKLREIDNHRAELIWYDRPDEQGAKTSNYRLVPVSDAAGLKQALDAALGVRVVVQKTREIFLYHNVRLHLDRVRDLGTFLEFEAVLPPDADPASGEVQIDWLSQQFHLDPTSLLEGSYADLLEAAQKCS